MNMGEFIGSKFSKVFSFIDGLNSPSDFIKSTIIKKIMKSNFGGLGNEVLYNDVVDAITKSLKNDDSVTEILGQKYNERELCGFLATGLARNVLRSKKGKKNIAMREAADLIVSNPPVTISELITRLQPISEASVELITQMNITDPGRDI